MLRNPPDRNNVGTNFQKNFNLLQQRTTLIYVHCKNGRDRSAGMVGAILRLCFAFTHESAVLNLAMRLDTNGDTLHTGKKILQAGRTLIDEKLNG